MPGEFERPRRDMETVADTPGGGDGAREKARAASRDLLDRAVEKKDELKQRASGIAEDQRSGVANRASAMSRALHGAADALRDNGEPQLSDWMHQAAGQVNKVAGYLEGKRTDGMADDLENLARNNPALFLGGTYLAGLALGRFLRATSPEHRERERYERAAAEGASESKDRSEAEPFERSEEGGSSVGNLGSTGWSGVGVAPGAFGAAGAGAETSSSDSGSGFGESPSPAVSGSDRGLAGSAAGSTDSFSAPVDGERSARSVGFSEPHVVQTDRDLHEAPPRTSGGSARAGSRGESSDPTPRPDRDDASHSRDREPDAQRDRDREV